MKQDNKLVKDYKGDLIPKTKARKISDKYYEEGVTCFLMEDEQWYRVTSIDKIVFDHFSKKYVLRNSTKLLKGIINDKSEEGFFIDNDQYIVIKTKGSRSSSDGKCCLNAELAEKLGYVECIADGCFYLESELSESDKIGWLIKKNIPNTERSKSYNLASDPARQKELENSYKNLKIKPSVISKRIASWIGDFSFGKSKFIINL